jgi:predicted DNA-binding transcriptional regulator AlpA
MTKRSAAPKPPAGADAGPLLTTEQAAALIGFHPSYLAKARLSGTGPRFLKIGPRSVRYRRSDIDAWLAGKLRISTADAGG